MNTQVKRIYNFIVVALLIAAIIYAFSRFVHLGSIEYTDDAQVHRHITPINTRVGGFIKEIRFDDYQRVRKGDTLIVIEDAEYRLLLAQAEANFQSARQGTTVISAGIKTTANNVKVAEASIADARIEMENAKTDYERFASLIEKDAVTRQQYDNAKARYDRARVRYEQAAASMNSTSLTQEQQTEQLTQSASGVSVAEAAVNLARLNLSYTVIVATTDGVMARKDIHEGQLVMVGQQLARIVDADDVWVVANYREAQLKHIAVGNKVTFTADAIDDVEYQGIVESLSPATGAAYSTHPADNATGNFIKV